MSVFGGTVEFLIAIIVYICCFFFFQAEDGIRDAQESRGLGDVYKRQSGQPPQQIAGGIADQMSGFMLAYGVLAALVAREPVSYTHLTLPTIYSV